MRWFSSRIEALTLCYDLQSRAHINAQPKNSRDKGLDRAQTQNILFRGQTKNFFIISCLYVPGFHKQVFKYVKKFVGTIKENERKKEEQKERPCCGFRSQFTKCAAWPRSDRRVHSRNISTFVQARSKDTASTIEAYHNLVEHGQNISQFGQTRSKQTSSMVEKFTEKLNWNELERNNGKSNRNELFFPDCFFLDLQFKVV